MYIHKTFHTHTHTHTYTHTHTHTHTAEASTFLNQTVGLSFENAEAATAFSDDVGYVLCATLQCSNEQSRKLQNHNLAHNYATAYLRTALSGAAADGNEATPTFGELRVVPDGSKCGWLGIKSFSSLSFPVLALLACVTGCSLLGPLNLLDQAIDF